MLPAIEELIPHRAPLRFVNALTSCEEKRAAATMRFAENDFAVQSGKVIETALVECIAQTVAAALGLHARSGVGKSGASANGMLVAVSNFKTLAPASIERTLLIEIHETRRLGPMVMVHGKISCDGKIVATGDLSLYA